MPPPQRQNPAGRRRSPRGHEVNKAFLQFLRMAWGYSQEEVAAIAGVSVRLIVKAEAGQRLQASSVQILASTYQQPSQSLLAATHDTPLHSNQKSVRLLQQWMNDSRGDQRESCVKRMTAANVICHSSHGRVVGQTELISQLTARQTHRESSFQLIEQFSGDLLTATCRWRIISKRSTQAGDLVVRLGTTTIQIDQDKITEIWDFSDPRLPENRNDPNHTD